jgi:cytoskeletal protein RodZ
MEENRAQKFLKELQSLDEPAKNRILIIATVVIMIVVLFVWIAYFNSIVIPSAAQTDKTATTTATTASAVPAADVVTQTSSAQSNSGSGFWKGMESGFTNLFHGGSQTIAPANQ